MTRYPALVVALAWCAALTATVVLVPAQPIVGVIAVGAAAPALALGIVMRPALLACALAAALLGVGRAELPPPDTQAQARADALVGTAIAMTGRVADDARSTATGAEALVQPTQMTALGAALTDVGNVLVRWRGPETAGFGDRVKAAGKLVLPRDTPDFDRRVYLALRGVFLELDAASFDVIDAGAGVAALPSFLRARYTASLDGVVPSPHASVLLGIVLGIKQGIPPGLQQALIATGLIHLLVLSGLKVAVFARIVHGALVPLLGRLATWPALGLIALYALVGGATPAAVRASAMGGLAIVAANFGRPSHVWTSLALTAAAMLGWHPDLAWDVGFQLSFAGTAAIILLAPAITRRVRFLPHLLREPFAVTCAAQIGTAPMMVTDFHVLSPVAPVANALTLPILPVLVTAGLVLGVLGFLPDVARVAAIPVAGLLMYIEQVAYVLARVPAAAFAVPAFPTWLGVAYYAAIGPAVAAAHTRGRHRKAALATAVLAPVLISTTALAAWAHSPPEAIVMNVGDGQAVLLRGPDGAVLVDGGPSPARLAAELGTQLPPWQRGLDGLIITAPGLGHVGGLAGLDRSAVSVVVPGAELNGSAWRTAALEQAIRGGRITRAIAGATLHLAGFEFQVLAPEPGAPGDEPGAADLAFRAVAPDGRSFCDLSDLDIQAQTDAAARLRGTCTYMLLAAGGKSRLSPDLERAAITNATTLIASRGQGRLAAGYPADVLRTDQEGTIRMPL